MNYNRLQTAVRGDMEGRVNIFKLTIPIQKKY